MASGTGGTSTGLRLEAVDDVAELEPRWRQLAEDAGRLFSTPEWMAAWWRHLGGEEEPRTLVLRADGGEPVAVLPLAAGRVGPVRALRFAGHGPADASGPVCAPELVRPALEALAGGLEKPAHLLAERVPLAGEPPRGFVELQREQSPTIDIGAGWEAYLKSRSSNFRSQVKRKERKLQRESGLEYRLAGADTLEADMATLIRLHEARWGSEGSGAFAGARAPFHLDFARSALERGWLRLWVAEVEGGRPIAAWYGFRFAGEELYYQSGRDPEWDRSSIGLVLLAHTIRAAAGDGVSCYRLLRGGESYKDRFASGDEPVVTIATSRGALGRASIRCARSASSWGPARRLLGKLRG